MSALDHPEVIVTLLPPDGTRRDVSQYLDLDAIGSFSETLEDDFLALTHSDMDVELQDQDGDLWDLLSGAEASEEWGIEIERATGTRRMKYDLLFAGILDLPLSLSRNRKSGTVSAQAYSFSKLLERVDVSALAQGDQFYTLAQQVASVTAATSTITLDPGGGTGFLYRIGDRVALDDGTNREEFEISETNGFAEILTVADAENTFADAAIELLTPWPRHQSVQAAAEALLAQVDIDQVEVDIETPVYRYPFLSGFNPGTGAFLFSPRRWFIGWEPDDFVRDHRIRQGSGTTGSQAEAVDATSGFTTSATGAYYIDWTPYSTDPTASGAMPSSLVEFLAENQDDRGTDTQLNLGDFTEDDKERVTAADHVGGDRWTIEHDHAAVGNNAKLDLHKNGTFEGLISQAAGTLGGDYYHSAFIDWFAGSLVGGSFTDVAVVSYELPNTGDSPSATLVKTYKDGVGGGFETVESAFGGGGVRTIMRHGVVAIQTSQGNHTQPTDGGDIRFYEPIVAAPYLQHTGDTLADQPTMQLWTMRAFGEYLACLYLADSATEPSASGFQRRATRCRLWRYATLEQIGDFEVADFAHPSMFATVAVLDGAETYLISIDHRAWCLSEKWVGTLPYQNLSDIGADRAMRDVALMTMSYLTVDRFRTARLTGRGSTVGDECVLDEIDIIEHEEQALTDDYMCSIEVSGTDRDGQQFSIVVGASHDSTNRADIDSSLIRDSGVAESIGDGYLALMGGARREQNMTLRFRPDCVMRANQVVRWDNVLYRVVEVETDFEADTQTIRLIEVIE